MKNSLVLLIKKARKLYEKYSYFLYPLYFLIIGYIFFQAPYFTLINNLIIDRLHGGTPTREEIILVGIDDYSLSQVGAWPWSREVFGQALKNLEGRGPAVVAVDILFLEPREGDQEFKEQVDTFDFPVIFGSKLVEGELFSPVVSTPNTYEGYIHFFPDFDGKIRQVNITQNIEGDCHESFSLSAFLLYRREYERFNCTTSNIYIGERKYNNTINFNYADDKFRYVSFYDLYTNSVDDIDFKDTIVLVGSTTLDLKSNLLDVFSNPSGDRIPGIEIHANIINSFLQGRFQSDIPIWIELLILLSVSFVILLLLRKLDAKYQFTVFVSAWLLMSLAGIILFEFGVNWRFVHITLILAVLFVSVIGYRIVTEKQQKQFVKKAFSQYISPQLLDKLMGNPELLEVGGEKREMTVLFCDIRGFTSLSEQVDAEELVELLNVYLSRMSAVILEHDGTIDKYIGDAIMAFWNAPLDDPHHRKNALCAVQGMKSEIRKFNQDHPQFPDIAIGIGLNTGPMVVGNIGSSLRFDYTVLGDNVNLGSRLEGLTKKYGVMSLVTESVVDNLEMEGVIWRRIDEVVVKGKHEPVVIYEPRRDLPMHRTLLDAYNSAFMHYYEGRFKQAITEFSMIDNDTPSLIMIRRINYILENPDEFPVWNGVWKWEEK